MKQLFTIIFLITIIFKSSLFTMQSNPIPKELYLYIFSCIRQPNLLAIFKDLASISQMNKQMYTISFNEALIKTLITAHLEENLQIKSLEQIVPDIIHTQDFIKKYLKKDALFENQPLLYTIKRIFTPLFEHYSYLYLALKDTTPEYLYAKLYNASWKNQLYKAKLLLYAGAEVNTNYPSFRSFPLIIAAERGHVEIVRILLSAKANPNIIDKQGRTPLTTAVCYNHLKIVIMLLMAKADLNLEQRADCFYTPLMWAVRTNNKKITEILLLCGANTEFQNWRGDTALKIAEAENNTEILAIIKAAKKRNQTLASIKKSNSNQ